MFVAFIAVVLAFLKRGGSKRQGVLLLGCCDAGKTLLFTRVCTFVAFAIFAIPYLPKCLDTLSLYHTCHIS